MAYLVYGAINRLNGHRYIGQTSKPLPERKRKHLKCASTRHPNMHFARAIKRYGAENFDWFIFMDDLSDKEADDLEIALIAWFKPEYNIAPGGKVTKPPFRPIQCLTDGKVYQSVQQTAAAYGLSHSLIVRLCQTGKQTKYGLSFTYDGASNCRRGGKKRTLTCLSDGKFHESVGNAAKFYNLSIDSIQGACSGRYLSTNGLFFAYCDNPLSEGERLHLLETSEQRRGQVMRLAAVRRNGRPVKCLNDGKWYETGRAAAKAYHIKNSCVYNSCSNGGITQSGLRFMYADQEKPLEPPLRGKIVRCLNDGKEYKSGAEAGRAYQLSNDVVGNCCRSGRPTKDGLQFMYADQAKPPESPKPRGWHSRKPILCLTNGVVYESLTAAGKTINRSDNAIYNAIKRNKSCVGLRFAYAA